MTWRSVIRGGQRGEEVCVDEKEERREVEVKKSLNACAQVCDQDNEVNVSVG